MKEFNKEEATEKIIKYISKSKLITNVDVSLEKKKKFGEFFFAWQNEYLEKLLSTIKFDTEDITFK